uniref:Uncharacterized protein n=1 Tax=Oryza nivara TaxID=4536 RepID=A0A0E0HB60_ORYNI
MAGRPVTARASRWRHAETGRWQGIDKVKHQQFGWPVATHNLKKQEYITSAAQDSAFNRDENVSTWTWTLAKLGSQMKTYVTWRAAPLSHNAWNVKLSETEEVVVSE